MDSLVVRRISTGTEHTIALGNEATLSIGRDATNDIQLPFPFVSSAHLCLQRQNGGWVAVDLGSTNGTTLDGQPLSANKPVSLGIDQRIRIQDVELYLSQPRQNPTTLAHSGTLVRRLIADGLSESVQDTAFLETLNGPNAGDRFYLPDHLDEFLVELSPQGIREHEVSNARLVREGDGFALDTELDVSLDQAPYLSGRRLRSGCRLKAGDLEFLFFDPLEEHLPEPEPEPEMARQTGPIPTGIVSEDTTNPKERGISEIVVLGIAASCLLVAAAVAIIFLF